MHVIYNLGIALYSGAIKVASLFNKKANLLNEGRKQTWEHLKGFRKEGKRLVWFHAASLGEFEQGRPLMELIKKQDPSTQLLVTFFSPSGYEVRKNYSLADCIVYLPSDSVAHARRFVDEVRPDVAVFVKYEFWYNFLLTLHERKIPTFIISAIFREDQVFFKSWGGFYRKLLGFFNHLFVQDMQSVDLLKSIGVTNVTQTGDTRFDRVKQIADDAKEIDRVAQFCGDVPAMVCGSTWPGDEELLLDYINNCKERRKWIIAPHEIHEAHIKSIMARTDKKIARFTDNRADLEAAEILIVDCIGLLSSIYRYGDIAYIGGGFGVGIHNTLEAAVYGVPVVFGPNYGKFNEAVQLIAHGGGFSIRTKEELKDLLDSLILSDSARTLAGKASRDYVDSQLGATALIFSKMKL